MKKLFSFLTILICIVVINNANAGRVIKPYDFQSGEPARASEVNENFDELGTQVNDNDSRIVNIETKLQNTEAGCSQGSSIRKIFADGRVACEADNDTTYTVGRGLEIIGDEIRTAAGVVSISGNSFRIGSNWLVPISNRGCVQFGDIGFYSMPAQSCTLDPITVTTGVQLPDGVTITSFECDILDNDSDSGTYIYASLNRQGPRSGTLFTTPNSTNSISEITYSDTTGVGDLSVDNRLDYYNIIATFRNTSGIEYNQYLRLRGCRVFYE